MILKDKRLPAYPLLVKDPYFSFWMPADNPTESDVAFWHGEPKPIVGIIRVDGVEYGFLGKGQGVALLLKSTEITAFGTKYTFAHGDFVFEVEYVSPLLPNDIDIMSLPVAYVNYAFKSENKHDVEVEIAMEERCCFDTCFREDRTDLTRVNRYSLNGCQAISIGLHRQYPLSNSMDEVGADWGYYYLCGDKANCRTNDERRWIFAQNEHENVKETNGFFTVAFDDIVSIYYFGQYLTNYWMRGGKTIFDAIEYGISAHDEICKKCVDFDKVIIKDATPFSDDYLLVLYASLRQSVAAHKLVVDNDGNLLFLSKECNSDGCIATVDVSYPSIPMYLLYNPALVRGMMLPIFKYVRMATWKYDFAPHDVGIYPYCLGQYYAIDNQKECSELLVKDWHKPEVLPFYYQMPVDHELFDFNRQMPVEESSNMIIMAYLYYCVSGDKQLLADNIDLLEKWVVYLEKFGLLPASQLCTDDFAGHLDKNANLAVKAIEGIYCFAEISRVLNNTEQTQRYMNLAKDYASQWKTLYSAGDHTTLAHGNENSYSMKYNMAIDSLLQGNLFDDVIPNELKYYDTVAEKYGVPLDNRNTHVKTDWMMWTASMGAPFETDKYAKYIINFFNDTEQRVPFSDWIDAKEPKYNMFRNRTVVSGHFFPILKLKWRTLCKK